MYVIRSCKPRNRNLWINIYLEHIIFKRFDVEQTMSVRQSVWLESLRILKSSNITLQVWRCVMSDNSYWYNPNKLTKLCKCGSHYIIHEVSPTQNDKNVKVQTATILLHNLNHTSLHSQSKRCNSIWGVPKLKCLGNPNVQCTFVFNCLDCFDCGATIFSVCSSTIS